MITEERVMELFAEDNPIPSVDDLDLAHLGSPAYLATLQKRSSEVTQVESRQQEHKTKSRSPMPWLVAAVAVILVGFGFIVFNRGGDQPAASADVVVIESLMEAWNTNDGDVIASHFTVEGVFDATAEAGINEVWLGRDVIADKTAGYSPNHVWDSSFDFTDVDGVIVFNRTILQPAPTDSGVIAKPQGIAVVISNGLIESFVIESDVLHYCIGDTVDRCKVRDTGEIRLAN